MSLSVSLPQAEPEGSPMRTVLPHSQSGIPDPYSSVLQEALDSLHPTRSQAYAPIKSEFLSAIRDQPDHEHTLSKPSLQERRRLVDRRKAAEKKAAKLKSSAAGSSGLKAWITGGTISLPKSGATISEEPRLTGKGQISRIPEKPIKGEDYNLTSIPPLKRGLPKEDQSVAQIEQKSRSDSALSFASQEASVRPPTVVVDAGLTMTGWQPGSPQGGSASGEQGSSSGEVNMLVDEMEDEFHMPEGYKSDDPELDQFCADLSRWLV
ncbi:hypothetical protein B484DRAFT_395080 [Ochromonadaceae sp. CCMP2298]|nr:hypothetical protein B484DRAFT_395080 [Ochromonadaceae sp. CCMP2298]